MTDQLQGNPYRSLVFKDLFILLSVSKGERFSQSHSLFNCMSELLYEKPRLSTCKSRITSLLCLKPSINYRYIGNKSKFLNAAPKSPSLSLCLLLPLGHDAPTTFIFFQFRTCQTLPASHRGCSAPPSPPRLFLQKSLATPSEPHALPTHCLQSPLIICICYSHSL